MTDEMIKLNSCPFCGHRAYIRDVNKAIVCTSCGANIPARNETFDAQLISAWNRRHTAAAPGEAELGRELIAWAADEKNVVFWQNIDLEECGFCHATRDAILWERFNHTPDCLHERARALRDSDE